MPLVPLFIFHHSLKGGLCGGCMGRGTFVGFWDPMSIRLFNDWEVDEVERLLFWLAAKKLHVEVNDKAKWMETKSGEFLVKSMYKVLEFKPTTLILMEIVWSSCVQPKLCFFARRLQTIFFSIVQQGC